MSRRTGSLASEVARLIDRSTREGECLIVPMKGYGEVRYDGGKRISAHRASFLVHNGPLEAGQVVRHTCDRIGCIEPTHLLAGSLLDNARDAVERDRLTTGLDHYSARVAPDSIREAVAEYLQGGKTQAEMARRLGVGATTFGRWVRAESRRDVDLPRIVVGRGSRIASGLKPCGTKAGYERHHIQGESVCAACRDAHRSYMRAYKAKRRAA